MVITISKYNIYGRTKGRKKKKYDIDQSFINGVLTKDINLNKKNHNILDIGSGSGENSLHLSMLFPKSKIIACENYFDGNLNLCNEIYNKKITNISIFNGNVLELIDKTTKQNVFDSIWILFPDPWPKKRHFKRRLINDDFIKKLISLIKIHGKIHIVTDSQSYFRQILLTIYEFRNHYLWENQNIILWEFDTTKFPQTKFYKKAIKYDRKPIYIRLKKL